MTESIEYLTTPIYYASGKPHLGHAFTSLIADAFKRYHQLRGTPARLLTGTDEHGQKILDSAQRAGIPLDTFLDERSAAFVNLWLDLDISFDRFSRTISTQHQYMVTLLWKRLVAGGDIYLADYSGLYCVDCEQYFASGENCEIHRKPLTSYSEPGYFFRLSHYQSALINHITQNPDFIVPEARRNEVLAFLKGNELRDLCVSRTSTRWGIPVPGDPEHVIYVWLDALVTYLPEVPLLEDLADHPEWQSVRHFIGKDILIFHSVYWPAFLLAAGLHLPRQLLVNGWLTVEGQKIAKSNPATIIDPVALTNEVGVDGLRHYLFRQVKTGSDLDFSQTALIETVNSDLANSLGNLVERISGLVVQRHEAKLHLLRNLTPELSAVRDNAIREVETGFENGDLNTASRGVFAAVAALNRYLQQQEPWRQENEAARCRVLSDVLCVLHDVSLLLVPLVPDIAERIRYRLGIEVEPRWQNLGVYPELLKLNPGEPVYRRRV